MQEQIYAKVRAFAEKNRMFDQCGAVAAGVSGGGDSVTMLDILNRLKEEYGFQITAVHVNHGIRGAEAQRDQEAAEKLCRKMGIPCRVYCLMFQSLPHSGKPGWRKQEEQSGGRLLKKRLPEYRFQGKKEGNRSCAQQKRSGRDYASSSLQRNRSQGTFFHESGRGWHYPSGSLSGTEGN